MTTSTSATWIILGGATAVLLCGPALALIVVWLEHLGLWQGTGQDGETRARISAVRARVTASRHRSRSGPPPLDPRVYALLRKLREMRKLPDWSIEAHSTWHSGARLIEHPGCGRTPRAPRREPLPLQRALMGCDRQPQGESAPTLVRRDVQPAGRSLAVRRSPAP